MDFTYDYGYIHREDPLSGNFGDAIVAVFLTIYLLALAVVLIFALVSYIFHSIGLYTIGKRMGRQYPWLAFVPFARDYFQGELAGEIVLKNKSIRNPGIWNLILPIIGSALFSIFMVFAVVAGSISALAGGAGSVTITLMLIIMMYILSVIILIAVSVARVALVVLINKQILERFTSENMALIHSVASVFVPLYESLCFFVMRDKEFTSGKEQADNAADTEKTE